ncbi:MAG TPA: sigma-70 family RNA polymerase sigma factor [Candidatus Acidoferrum sp.]|nr:sigma-70 family RNA polymerase sigma factor [Candidatus Acidoferrum sp.]
MSTATVALQRYSLKPTGALNASTASKRKVLAEARLGNGQAFAEMVMPYAPGLYRRALRLTGNAADAEDARQEALLKAFSRLNQFAGQQDEGKDDLHAWVSRITTNASIDLIRQRREGKYVSLEEPSFAPEETLGARLAARTDNPEELFARRELRALMASAIAHLAPDLRQICLLRDVLQYSTHEVSARLGISTVAVRLRLFRAHRRLRESLRDRLRQKQQRSASGLAGPQGAKSSKSKQRAEILSLGSQAQYACGD